MTIKEVYRKSLRFQWILMSIVGILVYNTFTYAEDAQGWMPDAALRAAVREAVELPAETPLTKAHIQQLEFLNAHNKGISDITGLEFATNLRKLYLGKNPITDLGPLANLTTLKSLHLQKISQNTSSLDLHPLANLINLETLVLEGNGITDISPLAGLTNLRILNLAGNHIENLRPLMGLTENLRSLNLSGNHIENLRPLMGLTELRTLLIEGNPINDLTPLGGLNLRELDLSSTSITDLRPLATLINLEALFLQGNGISDISPLSGLMKLRELHLSDNNIEDLHPLSALTELRILWIQGNPIIDFSPLGGLNLTDLKYDVMEDPTGQTDPTEAWIPDAALRVAIRGEIGLLPGISLTRENLQGVGYINVAGKGISNITGLEFATNLRELDLSRNPITDLSPLTNLIILESLDLSDISPDTLNLDIAPLATLVNLEELVLERNGITDISPLAGLTNLRSLNLSHNHIEDLRPLMGLTELRTLLIKGNPINDLTPLVGLNLTDLKYDVVDNPTGQTDPSRAWMPDAALRAAVRGEIGLLPGIPLTREKLQRVGYINVVGKGISNITGLEFATNLRELYISQNPITNLRPLANLTQLVELHFWHFPANPTNLDLRPLTNLINLEVLSLAGNGISDITPLAGLKKLRELHIANNHIENFSLLAELTNLKKLWIHRNWTRDISPLLSLNLIEFLYDEVCDFIPLRDSVESRIKNRNFPSMVGMWPEGEESTKYDLNYGTSFGLFWWTSQAEPFGLRTQLSGDIEEAKAIHQQLLQRNPNILFLREVRIHNHLPSNAGTAFPVDSDFWLRDSEGRIVRNSNGEYMMNHLNPDLQDLLIERIVGFSECGIFDGILLDGFGGDASFGDWFAYELIIEARIRILREVRERVRDDFLIIVNAARNKPVQYAEYVNGSAMEPGEDYKGTAGGTYKLLQVIDETLLWNEENLRQPTINWAQGFLFPDQPPDSPDNQRRMRLFTARGLTHSDGYVSVAYASRSWQKWMDTHSFWYDFWDADLGKPIGAKGQLYENREGLFIREFTNGWAVYNRSGEVQTISLPQETTGVTSGLRNAQHTIPDLDGEIYLKNTGEIADLNGDDVVNILDLVIVANAFGKTEPDLNGDGVVNIQDLVIVANAF